jgi:hypothetical protein
MEPLVIYGSKDEMIHANDINTLAAKPNNVIVTDIDNRNTIITIIGFADQNNNDRFEIIYYYDSSHNLLSVLYKNDSTHCRVLYYKDNEHVDDDEIDDAITDHIKKWFELMEPFYQSNEQMISFIEYNEDSKTNYMKNKIKIQLPDVFIDEDYVAKAISHEVFEERLGLRPEDIRVRL